MILSENKKRVYFKNLDAIRFYAALMVFFQHTFKAVFDYLPDGWLVFRKTIGFFFNGGLGVSIFFVLSGFLITYLIIEEHNFSGKINVKKFYIRRFLRIWPLYFSVVIFSFIIYPGLKELVSRS